MQPAHRLHLSIINLHTQQQQTLTLAFLPQKHIRFSIGTPENAANISLSLNQLNHNLLYLALYGHHICLCANNIQPQQLPLIAILDELQQDIIQPSASSTWLEANHLLQDEQFYLRVDKKWFKIDHYVIKVDEVELSPDIIAQEQLKEQQKQAWKQQTKVKTAPYPPPNQPAVMPNSTKKPIKSTIKIVLWCLLLIGLSVYSVFS